MRNPWLVKFARGLLLAVVVGWHVDPLWFQGKGIDLSGAVAYCGRPLRLGAGAFPQQRCGLSACTQCEAESEVMLVASKLCSKCKSLLPVGEFSRDPSPQDGLDRCCKACKKQYLKMRRQKIKAANKNRGRPPDNELVFCTGCQRTLSAAEFSTDLMSLTRLKPECKACEKLRRQRYATMNEQRTLPASFPVPSALELQEALGIENARDRNEALSAYGMYFCPRCRRPKSYEAFYKSKHHKHGVSSWCKECIAEMRRKREKIRACACGSALMTLQLRVMFTVKEASAMHLSKMKCFCCDTT